MLAGHTKGRKRWITDTVTFWRMWHDESLDMLAIAHHFHVSISQVRATANRLGLKARAMTRHEVEVAIGRDPTEEEIWGPGGLTEQIRASWSPTREYQASQNARCVAGDERGRGRACRKPLQAC
jgi:hypothetical protein